MNNLVKVHNRNVYPLEEKFKGMMVSIPKNSYIEMDYDEAILFKGQYHDIVYDKGGLQDPKSYKYIEIDQDDIKRIYRQRGNVTSDTQKDKFPCHVCSKEFLTKTGFLNHIKSKHLTDMVDTQTRDELIDNEEIEGDEA